MIMATRAVPHLKALQGHGAARVRETGSHEALVAMDSQPHNGREAGGERKGTNTGARSPERGTIRTSARRVGTRDRTAQGQH